MFFLEGGERERMGRGPLRAIIFRDAGVDALRLCRHGCVADETLEHVCLQCPHVAGRRRAIDLALSDLGKPLSLCCMLATPEVALEMEGLMIDFLKLKET